jgi:hypothetical protein
MENLRNINRKFVEKFSCELNDSGEFSSTSSAGSGLLAFAEASAEQAVGANFAVVIPTASSKERACPVRLRQGYVGTNFAPQAGLPRRSAVRREVGVADFR